MTFILKTTDKYYYEKRLKALDEVLKPFLGDQHRLQFEQ